MNVLFNNDRLHSLVANLKILTGLWANVFDEKGEDIKLSSDETEFCSLIKSTDQGRLRCVNCDANAVKQCAAAKMPYQYRCHAKLCEVIVPIYDNGLPVAYMVVGQLLDDTPKKEQWDNTLSTLSWYDGDMVQLKDAFFNIKQYTQTELSAYIEILKALTYYVQYEGMVHATEYSDQQRLEMFIEQHYTEKISLSRISNELHIGTTKLCALAKANTGESITRLISLKRIAAAKNLLLRENISISEVAERVGFSDYNYFTKIFRSIEGITPSAYRKQMKRR